MGLRSKEDKEKKNQKLTQKISPPCNADTRNNWTATQDKMFENSRQPETDNLRILRQTPRPFLSGVYKKRYCVNAQKKERRIDRESMQI